MRASLNGTGLKGLNWVTTDEEQNFTQSWLYQKTRLRFSLTPKIRALWDVNLAKCRVIRAISGHSSRDQHTGPGEKLVVFGLFLANLSGWNVQRNQSYTRKQSIITHGGQRPRSG
jgi:hypothetical protein